MMKDVFAFFTILFILFVLFFWNLHLETRLNNQENLTIYYSEKYQELQKQQRLQKQDIAILENIIITGEFENDKK